jgi:ribosome-binding factor A
MHPYRRADRVGPLIQQELARLLEKGELHDPRLKKITITKIEMTDDLKLAKIFFSLIGDEKEVAIAQKGLASAKGMIRKLIAENVYLRYVPDLEFHHDKGLEYSQRVDDLLKRIHEQDGHEPENNK